MKVSKLYVYPIKSLQPTLVQESILTSRGLPYDRCFMLLKVQPGKDENEPTTLKNMQVSSFSEMTLFRTDIKFPREAEPGKVIVTYHPPQPGSEPQLWEDKPLEIPLEPDVKRSQLKPLNIELHKSPTRGYDMGAAYNDWFSERFGFPVVLAYLGSHSREVLGAFAPSKHTKQPAWRTLLQSGSTEVWVILTTIVIANGLHIYKTASDGGTPVSTVLLAQVAGLVLLGVTGYYSLYGATGKNQDCITFADCAPYLIVSETSVSDVSTRLNGEEMDRTKFRPNIVVSGAPTAYEEDFWAKLRIGPTRTRLLLTANCVRCQSLNIDYATGKMGTGESGKVLKKLMKDRRVDLGMKYSPVFGRYSFLDPSVGKAEIRVGDEVVVEEVASERTVFNWPGVTN